MQSADASATASAPAHPQSARSSAPAHHAQALGAGGQQGRASEVCLAMEGDDTLLRHVYPAAQHQRHQGSTRHGGDSMSGDSMSGRGVMPGAMPPHGFDAPRRGSAPLLHGGGPGFMLAGHTVWGSPAFPPTYGVQPTVPHCPVLDQCLRLCVSECACICVDASSPSAFLSVVVAAG